MISKFPRCGNLIIIFFVGQLHGDAPTEEHHGNLTIFCHNTLTATAYQHILCPFQYRTSLLISMQHRMQAQVQARSEYQPDHWPPKPTRGTG